MHCESPRFAWQLAFDLCCYNVSKQDFSRQAESWSFKNFRLFMESGSDGIPPQRKNMKNLLSSILVLTFLLFRFQATADAIKTTKAQVNKAIVYLSGVPTQLRIRFSAVPGINQLIFEGVSPSLDKQSIQASAKGSVVIMDVKFETATMKNKKEDSTFMLPPSKPQMIPSYY